MRTQVRKIGNSFGVILPKALVDDLNIKNGDDLYIIEQEDGALLTPYDPEFDQVMEAYDDFSHQYRNSLKELAK